MNFSKPQTADTVLGRQNRPAEKKQDISLSKKNRLYQQRQETHEQIIDAAETREDIIETSVSDTVINNSENPVYEHNAFDTKETIPEQSLKPSDSFTEQPKAIETAKNNTKKICGKVQD